MENKYSESAYNPYPWQMKGTYYEFNNNNETRFIEVYATPIDKSGLIERFGEDVFSEDFSISLIVDLIGLENIKDDTYFLYELTTYIGNTNFKILSEFKRNVTKFERIGFTSINQLNDYCVNRWGFNIEVFVPHSKTSLYYLID